MSAWLHALCASCVIMMALLLLSPITLASAKASSAQSIVFVNNSIMEPAFDSFIQIDSFSTAPPKILDSKVSSSFDYVSGGVVCDGWYFAIGTNFAQQQAAVSYINTRSPTSAVTVITPSLFHALACAPGDHAADAPPHILAIASSYGPKFFLATFDVNTSVLTPLASFPNTTDVLLSSDAGFTFTQNPLVAHAVFPKTDASKHTPVYCTIDVATLKVSSFTFPIEVSKPFFALSSPRGTVGLLQLQADDSFEWFEATAADGKLDIKHRTKTSLASYGGLSQGMVQCTPGGNLLGTVSTGASTYDDVIVELDLSTGQVLRSMNTSSLGNTGITAQAIACA